MNRKFTFCASYYYMLHTHLFVGSQVSLSKWKIWNITFGKKTKVDTCCHLLMALMH
jgi:hypothetical protein